MPVDFLVCPLGGERTVSYTVFTRCSVCNGIGGTSGGLCTVCEEKNPFLSDDPSICEHCNGNGVGLIAKC